MPKPKLTVVKSKPANKHLPPRKLGRPGLDLWNAITSTYDISDEGGREILTQACLAQDRIEQISTQLEEDGPTILVKNALREHPLLRAELGLRSFVVRSLQRLGLNVETVRPVGRPAGYSPPTTYED